jgi:hypothetical protein
MTNWQVAVISGRSAPGHIIVEVHGKRYLAEHDRSLDERLIPGKWVKVAIDGDRVVDVKPVLEER